MLSALSSVQRKVSQFFSVVITYTYSTNAVDKRQIEKGVSVHISAILMLETWHIHCGDFETCHSFCLEVWNRYNAGDAHVCQTLHCSSDFILLRRGIMQQMWSLLMSTRVKASLSSCIQAAWYDKWIIYKWCGKTDSKIRWTHIQKPCLNFAELTCIT